MYSEEGLRDGFRETERLVDCCREEVNQVLEKARGERFIGSALEAKVLLHVADAELAESLQGLQGVGPSSIARSI